MKLRPAGTDYNPAEGGLKVDVTSKRRQKHLRTFGLSNSLELTVLKVKANKAKKNSSSPGKSQGTTYLETTSWHPLKCPLLTVERKAACCQIPESKKGKLHELGNNTKARSKQDVKGDNIKHSHSHTRSRTCCTTNTKRRRMAWQAFYTGFRRYQLRGGKSSDIVQMNRGVLR